MRRSGVDPSVLREKAHVADRDALIQAVEVYTAAGPHEKEQTKEYLRSALDRYIFAVSTEEARAAAGTALAYMAVAQAAQAAGAEETTS